MSFDSLPSEIIIMILQPYHFIAPPLALDTERESTRDYIRLRLVSRTFSVHITPHIFRNVTIESTEYSLKRLEGIAESEYTQVWVKQYTYNLTPNIRIPISTRAIYDEYLRLSADPSGLDELERVRSSTGELEKIQSSTEPIMASIDHWLNQREFELSNDLHELHVKSLSLLPALKSIRLISPRMSLTTNANDRSWGPVVFRAILLAMHNRTQTNMAPVEDFTVEGITEECMLLPPAFLKKAMSAFGNFKKIRICMQATRNIQEISTPGWIVLIGRLIQSAEPLESLEIEALQSLGNIHFRALVSPYKSKFINKPEILPTAPRWPKLKKLVLHGIILTESHILRFLFLHKGSLRWIQLNNCEIKQKPEPTTTENSGTTSNTETTASNPWVVILRHIYQYFTPNSPSSLDTFRIHELYYGPRQKRMHTWEIELWQSYIKGIHKTEPPLCDKELCEDCQIEDDSLADDTSTDDSDTGFFFGGMDPFPDSGEDDLGETDEDQYDDDADFFGGIPPMHVYGWPGGY